MTRITIALTNRATMTHVPLAALGYVLRRVGVLAPLQDITLPIKTLTHSPGDKLIEALVLVLAGGRATAQADLLLRPNRELAQAWGQVQFAQQSTLADTLDAFDAMSLTALRTAAEHIWQTCSLARQHDFRTGWLWLDDDLTGLPASRHAEGSSKGYFPGEKTAPGGSWLASVSHPTAKCSAPCSIRALNIVFLRFNRRSSWRNACSA